MTAGWMPLVYGRTRRVDRWWREVPSGIDLRWAERAVVSVTAGGVGLDRGPRFVLARGDAMVLVGGACMARDLSDTMNTDGRRALFCFVGWARSLSDPGLTLPSMSQVREGFLGWARPVYDQAMAPDWNLHESQVDGPRLSVAAPPPWPPAPAPRLPAGEAVPASGSVACWPEAEADVAWDLTRAGRAALLVTGWERASDARVPPGAWVAADDVREPVALDHAEPPERTQAAPVAAADPHPPAVRDGDPGIPAGGPDPWRVARQPVDAGRPPTSPAAPEREQRREVPGASLVRRVSSLLTVRRHANHPGARDTTDPRPGDPDGH
jgi:hypothetical protein